MKITCQIRRWEPKNKSGQLAKIHGPGMAKQMQAKLGPDVARRLGWQDEGVWAQSNIPIGSDPVPALQELITMIASWDPADQRALGRIQVDFRREE